MSSFFLTGIKEIVPQYIHPYCTFFARKQEWQIQNNFPLKSGCQRKQFRIIFILTVAVEKPFFCKKAGMTNNFPLKSGCQRKQFRIIFILTVAVETIFCKKAGMTNNFPLKSGCLAAARDCHNKLPDKRNINLLTKTDLLSKKVSGHILFRITCDAEGRA